MLFVEVSSYFIMIIIYSSAIPVSEDSELRRSIKKFAMNDSKLLDSIGVAHMEQGINEVYCSFTNLIQCIAYDLLFQLLNL
jgi:hypothetical protein